MNNNIKLLSKKITTLFVIMCCLTICSQEIKENFVVVLDAGHGGKDPGNRGNGFYEKKISLKVALLVGDILKRSNLKVIYTRKKDEFITLNKRADIANKYQADLFISIHCDSHSSNAYGAGTFVLGLHANERNFRVAQKENSVIFLEEDYIQKYEGFDPNNPESVISLVLMQEEYLDQSILIASLIQNNFVKNLKRKNRTVKQAGFLVLRNTYMPSVLVELGFLTNKKEGSYLNSKKGQKDMSKTIADAIIKYKNQISKGSTTISNDVILDNSNYNNLNLKVQIASGSKLLDLKPYNFKGLYQLTYVKSGNNYKYFFENTDSYSKAKKYLIKAKKAGYKDAIIVAFNNGKRISINDFFNLSSD
tara:strand:+ start:7725 stop:8813 length:1089 start_codon:yes stop_codon:yes gene_type:complete